ncbi:hypothetical protein MCSV2_10082 [Mucispirillum schaedleri ASF457]|nr:hypothetical protein MCSV2_10082 [Mucispirillum schaedleri ASF457]
MTIIIICCNCIDTKIIGEFYAKNFMGYNNNFIFSISFIC